MHNLILKLSQSLDNSSRYQNTKSFFRALLNDVTYPYKKYFDAFMIGLIVISISVLILNKSSGIPEWLIKLDLYFVTAIFALEYILRVWVSHDIHKMILARHNGGDTTQGYWRIFGYKIRYMLSLPALIDFVAIFPQFRILRILKLYHYMHGASSLFDALLKKRFEFIFLGYMLFGITFTFGSIFYLLEFGENENIHSYLDAIYWALVTISTVGYGDISPMTQMGKIVSMFGIIFGIAMISFVTSVMVSAFSERFDELRNEDSISHVNRMNNVVLINGYGHLGATIANKLKLGKNYEPVIIEYNEEKAKQAFNDGYKVIHADGSSANIISTLYTRDNIVAMLTLRSSDIDNIYFILNAKSISDKSIVYSRINHSSLQAQYNATKVDGVVESYAVAHEITLEYLINKSQKTHDVITFFGYTQKSIYLCKVLKSKGISVKIFELDETRFNMAQDDGFVNTVMIHHQYHDLPILDNCIAVCAMDREELNVYITISLRANGFENEVIALSDTKEDNRKLRLSGVSKIFDMYEESATHFVGLIHNCKKV